MLPVRIEGEKVHALVAKEHSRATGLLGRGKPIVRVVNAP